MNSFEEWWDKHQIATTPNSNKIIAKFAWESAYAAGMERAAVIAETMHIPPSVTDGDGGLTNKYDTWLNGKYDAISTIAAAIREEIVK